MPPQPATRHILLAEDNAADAALVREALREHDVACDLHVVSDGAEAISFILNLDTLATEPNLDLLLLDMHLPRHDGGDILRTLRATEHHSQKPVIVMSSTESPGLRNGDGEREALYFFRKPSTLDEFMLLGGIVKSVLSDPTSVARGGA